MSLETAYLMPRILDSRYKILRLLGSGANGEVWLASDSHLHGQSVAIKILYPHLVVTEASFARFRTETRVTMKLSHPNIVPTFGMNRTRDASTYLVMEFNDGSSLETIIQANSGGVPIASAISWLEQIASGLACAHSNGIVHRDLKPGNILVSNDRVAKVSDFGLAQVIRAESRYTGRAEMIGSPQYMAPEVFRGELVDSRCDIYAFGAVAFELLTGKTLFSSDSLWRLAEMVTTELAPKPSDLRAEAPAWLDGLVKACLEKEKSARPGSFAEILTEFSGHSSAQPSSELSISSTLPDVTAYSFVTSKSVKLRYRVQQYGHQAILFGIAVALFLVAIVPPRLNFDAMANYAVVVFAIERTIGSECPRLRKVFGIRQSVTWPNAAYKNTDNIFRDLKLACSFIYAGYSVDTYSAEHASYPIHSAVLNQHHGLLDLLLAKQADLSVSDSNGDTPLLIATRIDFDSGFETLLKHNADPNLTNREMQTPLHLAARKGRADKVRALLASGADSSLKDVLGKTALDAGLMSFDSDTIALLTAEPQQRLQSQNR